VTINRLKIRFNRLNWLGSYLTKTKTVLKTFHQGKRQTTDYIVVLTDCFSLCLEKHFSLLKYNEPSFARE